ncbi:G2/mitotic-specific cyclin-B [Dictyocoela muelleri]|nr:G2/mitotic-specific cyclin-B [Dictyocoela muelleri]
MTRILKNKTNKIIKEEENPNKPNHHRPNTPDFKKKNNINNQLNMSYQKIEEITFNPIYNRKNDVHRSISGINDERYFQKKSQIKTFSDCSETSFYSKRYKNVINEKSLNKLNLEVMADINSNSEINKKDYLTEKFDQKDLSNLEPEELKFFKLREADDNIDILMYNDENVFKYFKEQEEIIDDYIPNQPELTYKIRALLIDWLVNVHQNLNLVPETLFLAVDLVDRFLKKKIISVNKIQLVGTTALLIASKFEEVVVPSIDTFISISGSNDNELKKAEKYMLRELEYIIHPVVALNFIRRCSKTDNYDIKTRTLAKYLLELTLYDCNLLKVPRSLVAVSCFYLSSKILQQDVNPNLFVYYSTYTKKEILSCARIIMRMLTNEVPYENVKLKYSQDCYLKVSTFMERYCDLYMRKKMNK